MSVEEDVDGNKILAEALVAQVNISHKHDKCEIKFTVVLTCEKLYLDLICRLCITNVFILGFEVCVWYCGYPCDRVEHGLTTGWTTLCGNEE
jgi:hypothetical protein